MKKMLLPLCLVIVGTAGGVGAGLMLKPQPDAVDATETAEAEGHVPALADTQADPDVGDRDMPDSDTEFVKLNNQFVVPLVSAERVEAMVVLSLSIEIASGNTELVYRREPKLRDGLLEALFDHANRGGFRGAFTDTARLDVLRRGLLEVAQSVLGPVASDVLITDLARQDV